MRHPPRSSQDVKDLQPRSQSILVWRSRPGCGCSFYPTRHPPRSSQDLKELQPRSQSILVWRSRPRLFSSSVFRGGSVVPGLPFSIWRRLLPIAALSCRPERSRGICFSDHPITIPSRSVSRDAPLLAWRHDPCSSDTSLKRREESAFTEY
jgi:hypothetical protein